LVPVNVSEPSMHGAGGLLGGDAWVSPGVSSNAIAQARAVSLARTCMPSGGPRVFDPVHPQLARPSQWQHLVHRGTVKLALIDPNSCPRGANYRSSGRVIEALLRAPTVFPTVRIRPPTVPTVVLAEPTVPTIALRISNRTRIVLGCACARSDTLASLGPKVRLEILTSRGSR
jgi:hypothetical protein